MPAAQVYAAVTNIVLAVAHAQEFLLTDDRTRITAGLRELQGASDADGAARRSVSDILRQLDGLAAEVIEALRQYPTVTEVQAQIFHLQACRGALRRAFRPRSRAASSGTAA